jgi:Zn-dependent protease with chaperone function
VADARYADGKTPTAQTIAVAFHEDGVRFLVGGEGRFWPWDQVARADDQVGAVILRREPDSGERLTLSPGASEEARAVRPALFDRKREKRSGRRLAISLIVVAACILALVLVGVPMAAGPIARAAPANYEAHLGDVAWMQVEAMSDVCETDANMVGVDALQALVERLSEYADIPFEVLIYAVDASFPNAFALPGGTIVVTDELIDMAEDPSEIAGVIAHEMAHLEKRHVLANMIRQSSLGMVADIVLGGGGIGQTIAGASMSVAAMRHSCADEAEADRIGRGYLRAAGFDPGGMGAFFEKIHELEKDSGISLPELLSSHPDSARRAQESRAESIPGRPAPFSETEWKAIKSVCGLADRSVKIGKRRMIRHARPTCPCPRTARPPPRRQSGNPDSRHPSLAGETPL